MDSEAVLLLTKHFPVHSKVYRDPLSGILLQTSLSDSPVLEIGRWTRLPLPPKSLTRKQNTTAKARKKTQQPCLMLTVKKRRESNCLDSTGNSERRNSPDQCACLHRAPLPGSFHPTCVPSATCSFS